MASNEVFITEALDKLEIESGHFFYEEQQLTDNCLLKGRDILAFMPMRYSKSLVFQVFLKAMNCNMISEAIEPNAIVLVICPLRSIVEDQVKEGESLSLKWITLDEFMNASDHDTH